MKVQNTITISSLIRNLQAIKETHGNLSIYLSSDEEGNSLGTIYEPDSFSVDELSKSLILYPYGEGINFEDFTEL